MYSSCLCNRRGALRRSCSIDFPVPDSLMVEQQRRGRTLCRDGLSARGGRLGAGSHSALFPTRSGRTAAPNSLEANPELQAQEKKKKILEGPAPAMAAAAARPKLGNGEAIGGLLAGQRERSMLGALASGIDDGSAAGIALLLLLLLPLLSLPRLPPPPPTCATYLTHTLLHTVGEPHSPCPSFFPPPRRRPSRLLLSPLPVYAPTPSPRRIILSPPHADTPGV